MIYIKVADDNYVSVKLLPRFHVDGPDGSGNWPLRGSGDSSMGTVELASYPTQAEAEGALSRLASALGWVGVA